MSVVGDLVQGVVESALREILRDGGGILALALQYADLLGKAVAPALQFLGAGLDLLALGFQRVEGSYIKLKLARCQALGDCGDIFA